MVGVLGRWTRRLTGGVPIVLADRSPSDGWVLEARWIGPGGGRLGKGDRVTVTGQLRQRTWETAEGRSGR
jgi:hypothetical protein